MDQPRNTHAFVLPAENPENVRICIESTAAYSNLNLNWSRREAERTVFITNLPYTMNDLHSVTRDETYPICHSKHPYTEELRAGKPLHFHHGRNWRSVVSMTHKNVFLIESLSHLMGRSYTDFLFDQRRDAIRGSREAMRRDAVDNVRTSLIAILDLLEFGYEVAGRKLTAVWLVPLLPLPKEDYCPEEFWAYLHTKKLMVQMVEQLGVERSVLVADLAQHPYIFLRKGLYAEPLEELKVASSINCKNRLYMSYLAVTNLFHCVSGSGRHFAGPQHLQDNEHFVKVVLQAEDLDLEELDNELVPPPKPLTFEVDGWTSHTVEQLNMYYHVLTLLPPEATPLIGTLIRCLENSPMGSTFDRMIGETPKPEILTLAHVLNSRHDTVSEHYFLSFYNLQRRPHAKIRYLDRSMYCHYSIATGWRDLRQHILRIMDTTSESMDEN